MVISLVSFSLFNISHLIFRLGFFHSPCASFLSKLFIHFPRKFELNKERKANRKYIFFAIIPLFLFSRINFARSKSEGSSFQNHHLFSPAHCFMFILRKRGRNLKLCWRILYSMVYDPFLLEQKIILLILE